jgi:hypothetical protein
MAHKKGDVFSQVYGSFAPVFVSARECTHILLLLLEQVLVYPLHIPHIFMSFSWILVLTNFLFQAHEIGPGSHLLHCLSSPRLSSALSFG